LAGDNFLGRFARIAPRGAVCLLIVLAAAAAWMLRDHGMIGAAAIRDAVAGSRAAALLFVALQIVASLTFVPRTIMGIAAGLIFGFAWGALWAILGAEAGAAAGFALWRWIGGGGFEKAASPRVAAIVARVEKGGWRSVAIARLIPGLPHSVVNTALALTTVGWTDYLVGSMIGMLPMTLLQVDIGAAGGQLLQGQGAWIAGSLLLMAGLAGSFLIKRLASRRL
jgi:uncharacterized membrane protein YdjX (TVP38/TMEM64 family)